MLALFTSPLRRVRLRHLLLSLCSLLLVAAIASAAASAESKASLSAAQSAQINRVLGELEKVRNLQQTALSPDGNLLAWVVDGEHGGSEIELAPRNEPQKTRRITAGDKGAACDETGLAWSPSGNALAFLSDCQSHGQTELYLYELSSKAPRRLTHLHGYVEAPQFSPDGQQIGFLYVEGATRPSGALAAMKPPSGVIGEDGLEIQRVAAVDVSGGPVRSITPANLHVYEFDWSPASKQVAYVAAAPPGENNWWVSQLYTQALGGEPKSILAPETISGSLHGLQIAVPRWSRDGKAIAFIAGLMSDQGATGGNLYLIAASGGSPVVLVEPQDSSVAWFELMPDSKEDAHILTSEIKGGSMQVVDNVRSGSLRCLSQADGPCTMSRNSVHRDPLLTEDATVGDGRLEGSLSLSADGKQFAFVESSLAKAPEVFAGPLGQPVQATHYNELLKPAWGRSESLTWKNDGFNVQGWLVYPANYDPAKKYPMIVMVHGGPSAVVLPHWPGVGFGGTPFSAVGYFVLEPNPRGSYGQGEAFTEANRKDFGYGDLRDILAGVDSVVAKFPVDSERIGLTGWSYGGFMTMFAVTQTNRFHAAVAGAGISNWQSYYGENSIDQWMTPFFGATVYDDPRVYAKSSAIEFIQRVKTPTLAVVGDRDGECPAPQSFEFWHALRAQHVPTELVVYPNEGHRFADPVHRRDVLARALQWFEQYMPSAPSQSVAERRQ